MCGIAGLAATAFLVDDAQMPGEREIESYMERLWYLCSKIPSLDTPGRSVMDETVDVNLESSIHSECRRLVKQGHIWEGARLSDKVECARLLHGNSRTFFRRLHRMGTKKVCLIPLSADDREQFILDNQWAFKYGALLEFGKRDEHLDRDGEIISRRTIERCIDAADNETYRIVADGKKVGGVILKIDRMTGHNHLEILFISPEMHSRGIGYEAWRAVEALHPETVVWETYTPYFEKRNIHFYVNKCGFHIVEFFTACHTDSQAPADRQESEGPDEAFRFEKVME